MAQHRPKTPLGGVMLVVALASAEVGCSDAGLVEVSWQFVDASVSDRITDACDLPGESADGDERYDMRVRLTVSESTDACREDPLADDCVVASSLFECSRTRGAIVDIPASDEAYLMVVDVEVHPESTDSFVPTDDCVSVPGPRTRLVTTGKITDLAVYQFVVRAVRIGETNMDLDVCRGA